MKYGDIPGIDKPVSRLVQGTNMLAPSDLERGFALLDGVLGTGCTTFDTAHSYKMGDSERAFGRWVQERGVRERTVIISKGAKQNEDRQRVTPFDITSDLYDSLARLGTDYVDLYLVHRDDLSVPVGPIVEVLNEHLDAGRIRALGVSNWSHERIQMAITYAAEHGLTPFVASSPAFSLAEQKEIQPGWEGCISISGPQGREARQWYAEHDFPVFTWSSLAGGFFTGRFTRDNLESFSAPLEIVSARTYGYEDNFQRLDRAKEMAAAKGVTVPQLALAYVLRQPFNIFAITGCLTPEEFVSNAAAFDIELSSDELAWLEGAD